MHSTGSLQLCGCLRPNSFSIFIFSEIKLKADLFNLNQKQKTRACFHAEFKLDTDVRVSRGTKVPVLAFTVL